MFEESARTFELRFEASETTHMRRTAGSVSTLSTINF